MKFKSDSVRVRETIRRLMHDREMPMTRLAMDARINYSTVRAYFAGRTVMRIDMVERLLEVLGVDLSAAITEYVDTSSRVSEMLDETMPTEH